MYLKELENYDDYVDYQNRRSGALINSNTVFRDLKTFNINFPKNTNILDVGCRAGAHTVREFINLGYINSYGVDIGKQAESHWANYSCKSHLVCKDIHEGSPFDLKWGFITISHTLEHCYNPKKVLEILHNSSNSECIIHGIIPIEESVEHFQRHAPHMIMFESHDEHIRFYEKNGFKVIGDTLNKNNSILFAKKK